MSELADNPEGNGDSDPEATVVVSSESEATVVVDRGDRGSAAVDESEQERDEPPSLAVPSAPHNPEVDDSVDESTVVVSDRVVDPDATLVVDKPPAPALTKNEPRRRGLLRPAPVSVDVLNRAVQAPGPGAIATYASRGIQPPPPIGTVDTVAAAVRQDAATIPSIRRRSSTTALIVFVSIAGAIVVSAGGLIAIGFVVW